MTGLNMDMAPMFMPALYRFLRGYLWLFLIVPAVSTDLKADTQPLPGLSAAKLIQAARDQIGQTLTYDPSCRALDYPMGDVPLETGVCSDVVIRAFRACGLDLQQLVHEDMKGAWQDYPKTWGLDKPDTNIDHRRVPNLMTYFKRNGYEVAAGGALKPGDIVVWDLSGSFQSLRGPLTHIGIVTDKVMQGRYQVVHNIGEGAQEEDLLQNSQGPNEIWRIIGHYRVV